MDDKVSAQLLRLNHQFYQTFAAAFAETRGRVQPGVALAIRGLDPGAGVLDLGCGHGELARALAEQGHHGRYVGLDASRALLELARRQNPHPDATFLQVDLADPAWSEGIAGLFDQAFAFAVLHHLPGERLRLRLLQQVRALLAPQGRFTLSVWNFLASERLRGRVVPWEEIGLSADMVDEGDYLLDWRRGGHGLRYVHHFSEAQLRALAERAGFDVQQTYYSDGEGGQLGLYQVWASSELPRS